MEGALRSTRCVVLSLVFEVRTIHLRIPEEQCSIEECYVGILYGCSSNRLSSAPSAAKGPINRRADAPVAAEVDRRASLGLDPDDGDSIA